MKSLKITALSLVLVLLLAACGAKNDTPDEPAVDPTPRQTLRLLRRSRWKKRPMSASTTSSQV